GWRGSGFTSVPKMCSAMLLFGAAFRTCGSIDVTSALSPMTRSAAKAVSGANATARAASHFLFMVASRRNGALALQNASASARGAGRRARVTYRASPGSEVVRKREFIGARGVGEVLLHRPGR